MSPVTHTPEDGPLGVYVGIVDDPVAGWSVLLQCNDGWFLTNAPGARKVAAALLETADELDAL